MKRTQWTCGGALFGVLILSGGCAPSPAATQEQSARERPGPPATSAAADLAHDESRWFRNVRQLTFVEQGLARSGEAYFSPDMQRICFQSYPIGQEEYQIYVLNLDGTGLQMVSQGDGATTCCYFHPSGEKLIFA